jgi:hypothetical protein
MHVISTPTRVNLITERLSHMAKPSSCAQVPNMVPNTCSLPFLWSHMTKRT